MIPKRNAMGAWIVTCLLSTVVFTFQVSMAVRAEETRAAVLISRIAGGAAAWDGRAWRQLAPGDAVDTAQRMRTSSCGSAELRIGGATFLLGPKTIATVSANSMELMNGSANVTNGQGIKILISTPLATMSLGNGEALVAIDAQGSAFQVIRGGAQVVATNGGDKKELHAGEAIRASRKDLSMVAFPEAVVAVLNKKPDAQAEVAQSIGRLMVRDSAGREADALEVRELRVHARIDGAVALTEIEQTFFNPTDRQAEGTFYFPLPAGASLSRFAMYVNGTLVEGELVDRERARSVYEEIVRKMQDPALMEWQEGNIFKTRIFPIPAHGPKRILISYTQTLPAINGERRYAYPLVSKATQAGAIGAFEFEAEISGATGTPRAMAYADAQVRSENSCTHVKLTRKNFHPEQDLVIRYDVNRAVPLEMLTDRRMGEDGFFLLSYAAEETGKANEVPPVRENGRDLVVMLDTSLSRRADDYKAQMKVVRALLRELQPNDRFATISFDVVARLHQTKFVSGAENAANALMELEAILPLGATDLEAAIACLGGFLNENPARGRADVVLVSDGIATLGETATEKLVSKIGALVAKQNPRVHTVAMGSQHDRLALREIARQSGGLARTIIPGDGVESEAFKLALDLESQLVAAPVIGFEGGAVYGVTPEQAGTLVAGEELILTGRYKNAGNLAVRVADARADFVLPETESRHVYVPRLWARERLDALMLAEQSRETIDAIVQLSQEYTLITPYTSFLVLENEAEYEKYGIKRKLRRRYWEESGKLRSAPPPEEIRPVAPPNQVVPPKPVETIVKAPEPVKAPEAPKPFTLADLDLSLLGQRFGDGREVSTALSALCLETYYRYMQLSDDRPTQPSPIQETDRVVMSTERGAMRQNSRPAPIQARDVEAVAPAIPEPIPTDTTPENLEAHRAETEFDREMTTGGDEFLSQVALNGNEMLVASFGEANGAGHGSFGSRSGGGRYLRVSRHGGSRATENSCDKGLRWFAEHQYPDGHWGAAGVEETSLSLLALLGAGHTEKVGEYKQNVKMGLAWLVAREKASGEIGANAYEQALATMAVCEAGGMANVPATRAAAQRAIDYLCGLQKKDGAQCNGWADPKGRSHPLVSVWAVAALKSAKVSGLQVDPAFAEGALEYFQRITADDGAVGVYGRPEGKEIHLLHTAGAALALQFLGIPREDPKLVGAANLLYHYIQKSPHVERDGLFLRYFGSLVMFNQGGEFWKTWNGILKPALLEAQVKTGENEGSWEPVGIFIFDRVAPAEPKDAAKQISAALAAAAEAPNSASAFEALATALSQTSDMNVLREAFGKSKGAAQDVRALVRMRLGLVNLQNQHFDAALTELQTAWQDSGRAENLLKYYVGALVKAEKGPDALELLFADMSEGRISAWRRAMSATLLFDPAQKIADPSGYAKTHLKGPALKDVALLLALGQAATMKERHNAAAEFFGQAYAASERNERYTAPYVSALSKSQRGGEALALLLKEAADGRSSHWRLTTIADLLLDKQANSGPIAARIKKDLVAQADIRLAVYLHTAERAEAQKALDIAAELFGLAYVESGRREQHGLNYVRLLRLCGKQTDARELLVREARDDNRITPWRMTALAELVLADAVFKAAPDSFGDTQFAQRPRARVAFKYELAHAADREQNFTLAARLYEDIYISSNRPASVVQPYVTALMATEQPAKARGELESVIQAGFHTTWAFQTLGEAYRKTQRSETDILRAVSSETEIFPKDVQPHINLAQYYERLKKPDAALAQYREAVRLKPEDPYFYKQTVERAVALGRYDTAREMLDTMSRRFANAANVWGVDDADLLALLNKQTKTAGGNDEALQKQIRRFLVKDLVVVMNWDTNATDIDLHLTDPAGEEVFYSHPKSAMGATLDHDDTDGFGPETIALRRTKPGTYKVEAHFFGGTARTVVTVQIFQHRNGEDETVTSHTLELQKAGERAAVKTLEIRE